MNTSQKQLLLILTLTIHGGVPTHESFSSINGEELFHLALQQNVCSFLYPTLNKYREEIKLDELIMNRWKAATFAIASRQLKMLEGLKTIFDLFKSNGISVISLKGLALKQVYPQPTLRNMCDLDLFINEKDIQKSIELLCTQGYHPSPKNRPLNGSEWMHYIMEKPHSFSVELHRTLWHPKIMKKRNNQLWFDHIWKNVRQQEIEGIQYTALSPEDELINLVIHLARHLRSSSENIQQFCDIVLFIKTYWYMLDLEYINQTLKSMNLFTIYQFLLSTCYFFFGLSIPIDPNYLDKNKSEILMNDILGSKDEKESWRPLSDQIKFTLHSIPLTEKPIMVFKGFSKRARFLRSVGLNLRY